MQSITYILAELIMKLLSPIITDGISKLLAFIIGLIL